jgi:lipid A 3-O-deacylase
MQTLKMRMILQVVKPAVRPGWKAGARLLGLGAIGVVLPSASQAQSFMALPQDGASVGVSHTSAERDIWQAGIGEGFKAGTKSLTFDIGAGYGVEIFGGSQSHDLALASLSYGYMLGSVKGAGHWYAGNFELRGELFAGGQFLPSEEWVVGIAPHLRYDLATGTRWMPYIDIGGGVSATSIGPPDLSHVFEFNIQGAVGMDWFIRNNVALNVEVRYMHLSCGGINTPNLGLNNVGAMAGISWFF